jgi:hypothetical protein
VNEVAPGIWHWTAPHPEWRPAHEWAAEVASYALVLPDTVVLVDPQAPPGGTSEAEAFWRDLDRLLERHARAEVMITIPYHARSAETVQERYRRKAVRVWGHPATASRLSSGVPIQAIEPGQPLAAGATAYPIGNPRRQEMPLYFPSHKALAFGDAVVGVGRTLRVWDLLTSERRAAWYRTRFLPSLEPLLELDIAHVLVTHGPPAIGDGRRKLARALAEDPWHYRQR